MKSKALLRCNNEIYSRNQEIEVLIYLRLKQMISKFLLYEWWLYYDHEWTLIQSDKAEVQPFKCTIIWDGILKREKKNALTT